MQSWSLLGTPPNDLIVIFIFYFVSITIGPRLMKNREAFNLTTIIRIYNVLQVTINVLFAFIAYKYFNYSLYEYTWKCAKYEDQISSPEEQVTVMEFHWYFMALRTAELIETIFFVLRKKQNQVSFLHVYHHVSTVIFLYLVANYATSE
jgi:hypothetical protein